MIEDSALYHRCTERIRSQWTAFLKKRSDRLQQHPAEEVAENILEDLFVDVLDWELPDIDHQVKYADLVLTRLGVKYLIVEAKRPYALTWNRQAVDEALDQARRYADDQKIKSVAVSDGVMLYGADIEHGGLQDRVFVTLEADE